MRFSFGPCCTYLRGQGRPRLSGVYCRRLLATGVRHSPQHGRWLERAAGAACSSGPEAARQQQRGRDRDGSRIGATGAQQCACTSSARRATATVPEVSSCSTRITASRRSGTERRRQRHRQNGNPEIRVIEARLRSPFHRRNSASSDRQLAEHAAQSRPLTQRCCCVCRVLAAPSWF